MKKIIILLSTFLLAILNGLTYADSQKLLYSENSHCYQRIDNAVTWHSATNYCENLGGNLVTIGSSGENQFVFDNFISPSWWVWLGGTDEGNEGVWRWVTEEPWNYENWRPGEPNNCCPPELCGGTTCSPEHYLSYFDVTTIQWNDTPNDNKPFICEWDFGCTVASEVSIDIKPGSDPNCFNPNERGDIPVAIFGSVELNVKDVNPDSLALQGLMVKKAGKGKKYLAHYEYVNEDDILDLVVQFEDTEGWVDSGSGSAILTGELYDGSLIEGTDSICSAGPKDPIAPASINLCWQLAENLWGSPPTNAEIASWFNNCVAADFLNGGNDKSHEMAAWIAAEPPPVGISFLMEIIEPVDVSSAGYEEGYWIKLQYSREAETGSFLTIMVFDGTNWLWYGDREWLAHIEFGPVATMNIDIGDNVTFYTGLTMTLWDDNNYAYDHFARSAIITGPGLPTEGQILEHYFPEPFFRLYPKGSFGHPSGGFSVWLDDATISTIPNEAKYTISLYAEEAEFVSLSDIPLWSSTKTTPKGPVLNSELSPSLFPTLLTPISHDESELNIPGLVMTSWTNPSNMSVDWVALSVISTDLSTDYQISQDILPGETTATLDTSTVPDDLFGNQLYMHGHDIYERRFSLGWQFFR